MIPIKNVTINKINGHIHHEYFESGIELSAESMENGIKRKKININQ
tara:strand:+ start:1117 stop:1254 length:138 start_codon:yes stop_codon:yes gene_type:complete